MQESDGTPVLDNPMIVYGHALGDGKRHTARQTQFRGYPQNSVRTWIWRAAMAAR